MLENTHAVDFMEDVLYEFVVVVITYVLLCFEILRIRTHRI